MISGIVQRCGILDVCGETLTGIFVEIPEETLRNIDETIIYKNVEVSIKKTDAAEKTNPLPIDNSICAEIDENENYTDEQIDQDY